jgi:serine/threonine protein phosphatase 1
MLTLAQENSGSRRGKTSGKTAIVGHTPQKDGRVLDLGHLKCIDTFCGHGGLLTALDVGSGQIWQVTEGGRDV